VQFTSQAAECCGRNATVKAASATLLCEVFGWLTLGRRTCMAARGLNAWSDAAPAKLPQPSPNSGIVSLLHIHRVHPNYTIYLELPRTIYLCFSRKHCKFSQ